MLFEITTVLCLISLSAAENTQYGRPSRYKNNIEESPINTDSYRSQPAKVLPGSIYKEEVIEFNIGRKEVEDLLKSPTKISQMVDCLIDYEHYDRIHICDKRLKKAASMADDYFKQGECRGCKEQDRKRLNRFIRRMQGKYPKQYRRLINGVNK